MVYIAWDPNLGTLFCCNYQLPTKLTHVGIGLVGGIGVGGGSDDCGSGDSSCGMMAAATAAVTGAVMAAVMAVVTAAMMTAAAVTTIATVMAAVAAREDVVAELILMVNPLYRIMSVPMLNYEWCLALRSVLGTSEVWPK